MEHFIVGWTVPVNLKDNETERIKNGNIKGKHTVSLIGPTSGKITKEIEIDKIYVIEQGIAAVIDQSAVIDENGIKMIPGLKNKKIVVIDIGTNTINKIFIDNMEIKDKQRNLETGALSAITRMRDELSKKGFDFSIQQIQENFFMKRSFYATKVVNNKFLKTDLKPIIDNVLEKSFKEIIKPTIDSFISNTLNKQENIDKIIYTGGGVKLFSQFLEDSFNNSIAIIPEYPQLANALGAWKTAYYYAI